MTHEDFLPGLIKEVDSWLAGFLPDDHVRLLEELNQKLAEKITKLKE